MFTLHNGDCLEYMKSLPDKAFDCVITDPPYGLGDKLGSGGGKMKNSPFKKLYNDGGWIDVVPEQEIFDEIFRVSRNQMICGGNYFSLPPTQGIIAWDKKQALPTFSSWEYIWTSSQRPAKMLSMVSTDPEREHPTQKPVTLMRQLIVLSDAQNIFDPFMGSGSTGVACMQLGIRFIGCEIDPKYFAIAERRIKQASLQQHLFAPSNTASSGQGDSSRQSEFILP